MSILTKYSTANSSALKIGASFVFIALPIIGFILGMQYQKSVPPAIYSATPERGVVSKNAISQEKIYTNAKYKYTINYPLNWIAREFPGSQTGAGFQPSNVPVAVENEKISVDVGQKVISDPPITSFEEYAKVAAIKEIQSYNKLASIEKVTTKSGVVGYKTAWYVGAPSTDKTPSGPITYFEVPKNPSLLLRISGDQDSAEYQQMITTVGFSENGVSPIKAQ